jgi:hypothetical protein
MKIFVPVRTMSLPNQRGHWSKHSPLTREQKMFARNFVYREKKRPPLPVIITLTRICPKRNLIKDSDNLAPAMKAVRDGVALAYGVDDKDLDGTGQIEWHYDQRVGDFGVQVDIESPGSDS